MPSGLQRISIFPQHFHFTLLAYMKKSGVHTISGSFRLEHWPGGTLTRWKTPPFHGAHPLLPMVPSAPGQVSDVLLKNGSGSTGRPS